MNLRYSKNNHDLAVQDSVKRIGASKAAHFRLTSLLAG
jgi:hypothetical protein